MKNRIPSGRAAHRLGLAGTIAATVLLVWLSLGVGIIGADGDPDNRMFLGVAALGVVGALGVRLRPRGMAVVNVAVTLAVAAVGGYAIAAGLGRPHSGPLELALLSSLFVVLFLASAGLFRRAALGRDAAGRS